jgi:hypothetical protein
MLLRNIFKLSGKYSRFFSIDSISETDGYSFLALSIDFMSDLIKLAAVMKMNKSPL